MRDSSLGYPDFFFHAEDGIRCRDVTGVQTCALPILPLEMLKEETQASRRFRKVRGLAALEAIARAVAVDRIDLGFVDILSCEGCLDHPLLGPREELFWRRQIVLSTEPPRAREPVVNPAVAERVRVGEAFPIHANGQKPSPDAVERSEERR